MDIDADYGSDLNYVIMLGLLHAGRSSFDHSRTQNCGQRVVFVTSTLMSPQLAPTGTAMGCGLHNRGTEFHSRQGCNILLFSKAPERLWGPSIGTDGKTAGA